MGIRVGICWFVLFVFGSCCVWATDFHVATSQGLQDALNASADNSQSDCIYLASGTYTGGFTYATTVAHDLLLSADAGLDATDVILDGQGRQRILGVELVDGASLVISNMTFAKGYVDDDSPYSFKSGGGLLIQRGKSISLSHCVIRDCHAEANGGGMYTQLSPSEVYVTECTIISNSTGLGAQGGGVYLTASQCAVLSSNVFAYNVAPNAGGAVYVSFNNGLAGPFVVSGNQFVRNRQSYSCSPGGGAIYISLLSNAVFEGNSFIENKANSKGGALNVSTVRLLELRNNVFDGNIALYDGGAVYSRSYNMSAKDNMFVRNIVKGGACYGVPYHASGGAVALGYGENIDFYNNVIVDNIATARYNAALGGGLHFADSGGSAYRLVNNTIYGNSGPSGGGGVYVALGGTDDTLDLYNNIVWGNSATGFGSDVLIAGDASRKAAYHNNWHDADVLWDVAVSNIDMAPQFASVAQDDYQLDAGSAGIDQGNNAAPGLTVYDLDGYPRIDNGVVDLGAYEQSTQAFHPADTNCNWNLEVSEVTAYSGAWHDGRAVVAGPSPVPITYVTRGGYLKESGGDYHNQGGPRPLCWETGTGN